MPGLPRPVKPHGRIDLNAEYGIPLFPTEAIPLILDTVLRYACTLKKTCETEWEDDLSDRLFKLLRKDKILRSAPFVLVREHQLFSDDAKEGHSGRIDINVISLPGDAPILPSRPSVSMSPFLLVGSLWWVNT